MTKEKVLASGSFEPLTDDYALSISSGGMIVTFDFLSEDDLKEIRSCINCMLPTEE